MGAALPDRAPALDSRPLVLHVVYRFDTGGLENGIVNLINRMSLGAYRHVVLALTEVDSGFSRRIQRDDVGFISLHKQAGHAVKLYPRMLKHLHELAPAVVHTRNLAALEMQVPAAWARVPARVHGEHGRDVNDLDGSSRRYQWLRRAYKPFVHHYVALSRDLASYLTQHVGVPTQRLTHIYNGVDVARFHPTPEGVRRLAGCPFDQSSHWLVGTVGRMQLVKNQTLLARAFIRALELQPALRTRARLVMAGDGPLRALSQALLQDAGLADLAWLPGERNDVPEVMRALDCFVLPSLAEGISNTILEALATALPVIATDVGGNADLVRDGRSGVVVAAADVDAMAHALVALANDPHRAKSMGREGRTDVLQRFSLQAMVDQYQTLYDNLLRLQPPKKY